MTMDSKQKIVVALLVVAIVLSFTSIALNINVARPLKQVNTGNAVGSSGNVAITVYDNFSSEGNTDETR